MKKFKYLATSSLFVAPVIVISCGSEPKIETDNVLEFSKNFSSDDYISIVNGEVADFNAKQLLNEISDEFGNHRQYTSEFGFDFKNWVKNFQDHPVNIVRFPNVGGIIEITYTKNTDNSYDISGNFVDAAGEAWIEIPLITFENAFLNNDDSFLKRIIDVGDWIYLYNITNNFMIMDRYNYLTEGNQWWINYIQRKWEDLTFYTNKTREEYQEYVNDGGLSVSNYNNPDFQNVFVNDAGFTLSNFMKITYNTYPHIYLLEIIQVGEITLHYNDFYNYLSLEISLDNDESSKQLIYANVSFNRKHEL